MNEQRPFRYETDCPFAVKFDDDRVWVTLADGRVIGNPLAWHPWLANATSEQRVNVELNPFDVWWPALDEGLDIEGMLRGIQPTVREPTAESA